MTRRHLGQNFLYDTSILRRIIQTAHLSTDDLVVEIGPGPGIMTKMLAERVRKVIAVELDEQLFQKLGTTLSEHPNIELIHEDALRYRYEELPEFKVVANIPYYITTPIIFRLLELQRPQQADIIGDGDSHKKNLQSMTLTVQKEVAERIVASPGGKDYGVLSVMVQYHARPSLKFIIPKQSFRPAPRVDSAVIHMKILEQPSVVVRDKTAFDLIVKTAFSHRRKMLSNALRNLRDDSKALLSKAGIDGSRRPETLSIEEYAHLADVMTN